MTAQDTLSASRTGPPADPNPPAPPVRSVDTTTRTPDPDAQDANTDASLHEQADMPKLPHERDQSVDMTDGIPSAQMQQAYLDVKRGLVDTDAGREAHNVEKPTPAADSAKPGRQ